MYSPERFGLEDAPTPRQIAKLATIAVACAKRHDTFEQVELSSGTQWRIAPIITNSLHEVGEQVIENSRHTAFFINFVKAGAWNMRLIQGIHTEPSGKSAPRYGVSSAYTFDWNSNEVVRAAKEPLDRPATIAQRPLELVRVSIPDALASEWGIQHQLETVTRGDLDYLIDDVSEQVARYDYEHSLSI